MKKLTTWKGSLGTVVVILVVFCASLCLAQGESSQLIDSLSQDSKLIEPDLVLEDFVQGKTTTRVIVNLSEPAVFQQNVNFNDMAFRQAMQGAVQAAQEEVISRLDHSKVRITNTFVYVFGFSAEVSLDGLKELTQIEEVISINKDRILEPHLAQGIPLINATTVRSSYNGAGMAIAVCDTGIDYTHPRLGGGGFPNSKVIGGYDTGQDDTDPMDAQGHGTCCAGIAAGDLDTVGDYIGGVAHNAKLYALKITYNTTGGGAWSSDMIEAWEWCVTHQNDDTDNPIMVISTSFGGEYHTSTCDSDTPAMTTAAANCVAAGMTLFVSSGNEGFCDGMGWPACITHVNAVGAVYDTDIGRSPEAGYVGCISNNSCVGTPGPPCSEKWYVDYTTAADQVTTYSNTATFLDLFAPSNNAYTTDIVGGGGYSAGDYYSTFSGTSAACPYAAGAAACLQSAAKLIKGSYLTPSQVEHLLTSTGDPITDTKQGHINITKPRINLGAAVWDLAPEYAIIDLGVYGHAYHRTGAQSINDIGQVVGFTDVFAMGGGFFWDNGTIILLPTLFGGYSNAYDIDMRCSDVVGSSDGNAVLWKKDNNTFVIDADFGKGVARGINNGYDVVGSSDGNAVIWNKTTPLIANTIVNNGVANAVNDSLQVVGSYWQDDIPGHQKAFIWEKGVINDLNTLWNPYSDAVDINDSGQIVGFSYGMANMNAVLWDWKESTVTFLTSPTDPEISGVATGINNHVQVVGHIIESTTGQYPFLWEKEIMINLNDLLPAESGWKLGYASAINNNGEIIGWGTINGHSRSYLMKPLKFSSCDGTVKGAGYYYAGKSRIQVSVKVNSRDLASGTLSYYNSQKRISFYSTSIEPVVFTSANTAVVKGAGTVNRNPGYTFMTTITDSSDTWEMTIFDSSGNTFESGLGALSRGDLVVTTSERCNF